MNALTLNERITAALSRIRQGLGAMRIPADPTDPDIVLSDCGEHIAELELEAVARAGDVEVVQKMLDGVIDDVECLRALVEREVAMSGRTCRDYSRDVHCAHPKCAWLIDARAALAALTARGGK